MEEWKNYNKCKVIYYDTVNSNGGDLLFICYYWNALTGNLIQRLDILLCVYFITIAIALWDFVCCIAGDLAMKKYCWGDINYDFF